MSELSEDYSKAGFGGSLTPGNKTALILVDFLVAYTDRSSPLYAGIEEPMANARHLLELARSANRLVVHTRVSYSTPSGIEGGIFVRKLPLLLNLREGSPMAEIHRDVSPRPGELVVRKHYASAFFGTSLAATLTAARVDTVMITGLTTSGCIRATALDACQHGFIPLVVREAVGDRHETPHEANLFDIQSKYAEVIDMAAAKRILVNRASPE